MGRMKEEEKIERTIRGLLKLPENRRCINCNSLGPQYVCTTFLTFVCTNCSGVHREFTHRVKSVSVAKFTTEEVSALQAGGNERARQIYFKDWDPQRHSFPDGSNLHRLRDFIKHVYVDRKFTGERSNELPRLRLSNKDESIESKKFNIFQSRSISPRNEGNSERRDKERSSPSGISDDRNIYYYDERNSPRYNQSNSRYGGYKRSPVRFEIVDDRFRDDEFGNRRFSSGENISRSRSPDRKKNIYGSHSPVVNSSKEMLGEKMKALKFVEVSEANDGKDANDCAKHQKKIASSNDLESANGYPVEHGKTFHEKRKSLSLIDFSTECEPPDSATMSQSQQVSSSNSSSNQTLIVTSIKEMPSQASNENSLENLLFALGPSTPYRENKHEAGVSLHAPAGQMPDLFSSVTPSSTTSTVNVLEQPSSSAEQSPHFVPKQVQDTYTGVDSKILSTEAKSSNRTELPMDLFAANYSTIPAPVSGWQTGPPPGGMGFNMHYYPNAMPVPAFSNSSSSTNPFDINGERSQVQTTPFSSMRTSSSGTHSSQLKEPQSSSPNASMIPLQFPSFGSDLPHSAYVEQQVQNNMITSRPQGSGGFGSDGPAFGSFNTTQQPSIRYSAPGNATSFASMGGNPFE